MKKTVNGIVMIACAFLTGLFPIRSVAAEEIAVRLTHQIRVSTFVSTNNSELRFEMPTDVDWRALHFRLTPDIAYGTERFYTTGMNTWDGEYITKRPVATFGEAYGELKLGFLEFGSGLKHFKTGVTDYPTSLDIGTVDMLELCRWRDMGQLYSWLKFRYGRHEVMTAVSWTDSISKMPWDRENDWRPESFGDKPLMKVHGGNAHNYFLQYDYTGGEAGFSLLAYMGHGAYESVQIGKYDGQYIEPDFYPLYMISGKVYGQIYGIDIAAGLAWLERNEWQDDTMAAQLKAEKHFGDFYFKVQVAHEWKIKPGSDHSQNKGCLSRQIDIGRLYGSSYKVEGVYTIDEHWDLGLAGHLNDSSGWQTLSYIRFRVPSFDLGSVEVSELNLRLEGVYMNDFYQPYRENSYVGLTLSYGF